MNLIFFCLSILISFVISYTVASFLYNDLIKSYFDKHEFEDSNFNLLFFNYLPKLYNIYIKKGPIPIEKSFIKDLKESFVNLKFLKKDYNKTYNKIIFIICFSCALFLFLGLSIFNISTGIYNSKSNKKEYFYASEKDYKKEFLSRINYDSISLSDKYYINEEIISDKYEDDKTTSNIFKELYKDTAFLSKTLDVDILLYNKIDYFTLNKDLLFKVIYLNIVPENDSFLLDAYSEKIYFLNEIVKDRYLQNKYFTTTFSSKKDLFFQVAEQDPSSDWVTYNFQIEARVFINALFIEKKGPDYIKNLQRIENIEIRE